MNNTYTNIIDYHDFFQLMFRVNQQRVIFTKIYNKIYDYEDKQRKREKKIITLWCILWQYVKNQRALEGL